MSTCYECSICSGINHFPKLSDRIFCEMCKKEQGSIKILPILPPHKPRYTCPYCGSHDVGFIVLDSATMIESDTVILCRNCMTIDKAVGEF